MKIQTASICATSVLGGLLLTTAVQAEPPTYLASSTFLPAINATAGATFGNPQPHIAPFDVSADASADLPVIANLLLIPGVDAYAKFSRGQTWPTAPDIRRPGHGDEQVEWTYGAGLQYHLSPTWSLNADWDQFKLRSRDASSEVFRYSVGTRYRF